MHDYTQLSRSQPKQLVIDIMPSTSDEQRSVLSDPTHRLMFGHRCIPNSHECGVLSQAAWVACEVERMRTSLVLTYTPKRYTPFALLHQRVVQQDGCTVDSRVLPSCGACLHSNLALPQEL